MTYRLSRAALVLLLFPALSALADTAVEEMRVWGERRSSDDSSFTSPNSILRPEDMLSINATTTEDLVKYEPSLVIRRRFIGDANGTLGIRGSNMFQTSRSMVFADGVPLHYFLQSRWNGAPRWTLVSASEIAQVEVLYGPFSAEYSGNAMGGVVLIETAIPEREEFHVDVGYFSQRFEAYGVDEQLDGYKTFVSYGNRVGDASYYFSYNRLESDAQPQTYFYGGSDTGAPPQSVSGAIRARDELSNSRLYFGDSGVVATTTDNIKMKLGYDWEQWSVLANIAYEGREGLSTRPNSYLRDSNGNAVWEGNVEQGGEVFSVPASRLGVSEQDRDSLSVGLRLRGELSERSALEANLNRFAILRDEARSSAANPNAPSFDGSGQVTDFGDTGWTTAELKWSVDGVFGEDVDLVAGLRHEQYELNTTVYRSSDYRAGRKTQAVDRSGGETTLNAAFLQLSWTISEAWDATLGGRYEDWKSHGGYYADDQAATPGLDVVKVPSRDDSSISPKLSLGFQPAEHWQLRYALARAYRFPIVEELFSQYQAYNSVNAANPDLKPERGLHHNLMIERRLGSGYVRVNLFKETVRDVIESQTTMLAGGTSLRTFVPVDQVETEGVELIFNAYDVFTPGLNLRANLAWTDAEITQNRVDPSIVGNQFTRMPKWRGNLLANYHVNARWDVGANLQYASDSYGRLDNRDREDNVYGAQDGYLRLGVKTRYQFTPQLSGSIGIDNLRNDIDYVAHPWPGRTGYVSLSYDL